MSYDKLRAEILAARDRREELVADSVRSAGDPVIFLSLNIPGVDKSPPGALELFRAALDELGIRLSPLRLLLGGSDVLGPLAVLAVPGGTSDSIKRQCVELEELRPVMRLLDLDVYAPDGRRLGREGLGLPARRCLLCARPVGECIRLRGHRQEDIVQHVHTLLAPLRH